MNGTKNKKTTTKSFTPCTPRRILKKRILRLS